MAIEQQADARFDQVWQAALEDLQGQVSRANFETWLRSTSLVDLDRDRAVIAAPNTFAVQQLRSKFDRQIADAIATLINRPVDVDFVVRTAVSEPYRREPKPRTRPVPPAARERRAQPSPAPALATQQMELTAPSRHGLNPNYTFETFVGGSSNRLAHPDASRPGPSPQTPPQARVYAAAERGDRRCPPGLRDSRLACTCRTSPWASITTTLGALAQLPPMPAPER